MSGPVGLPLPVMFSLEDAEAAYDAWQCNCGPTAIAAICGLTLEQLRPKLGDFTTKGYTNPTLMWQVLDRVAPGSWQRLSAANIWPSWGLVRIQWGGPWMAPGVPARAQYRHTHWVGAFIEDGGEVWIFDVNAMSVGGWLRLAEWSEQLVPWLLGEVEPKADGSWHRTHVVEVLP